MPPQHPPEETQQVPQEEHTSPPLAPNFSNEERQTLCSPPKGDPKAKDTGCQEERLYLGGQVEAHQKKSLRAPKPNLPAMPWPRDQREPKGKLATEGRRIRKSEREATGSGTPPPKGSLELNEGVVQG